MARKMMYREVTTTNVKCAMLNVEDGTARIENLEDEIFIGNVSQEKAQRLLNKKYGKSVTILEVYPETNTYEIPVEEFIKVAAIRKGYVDTDS